MPDALTLNKITAQRGISIGEATRRIADLGWTPSYVQQAMTFPTDYKIKKSPRDPMKQVLRSYFPMQEEKDNRVYGALDAALRGDMFRNVEPRWVEWMKLFLAIIPFPEISAARSMAMVGRLARGFNTARFTRTFSILSASSVPVLEALRISGEVVTNLPMRDAVADAAARVREGAPIGRSLAASRLFPPMTIHLISSGESSGQLEAMLERAAISQERELDGLIAAMVGLLGPILIVVMGLFVMGIVFAMLLPIFQMNNLIH